MFGQKQQPVTPVFGQPVASNTGTSPFGTAIQGEATHNNVFPSMPATGFGVFGGGGFNAGTSAAKSSGMSIFGTPTAQATKVASSSSLPFWKSGLVTASGATCSASSDPRKQERLEALLKQSLLRDTTNVLLHLFSMRSLSSGQVMKPRILRTNKTFLAESSRYFSDLLNAETKPSDSSWATITDDDDVPSNVPIDDHGYESDSDLDDYEDLLAPEKDQPTALSNSLSNAGSEAQFDADDGSSENGSVGSSTIVVTPEQPRTHVPLSVKKIGVSSISRGETVIQKAVDDNGSGNQDTTRTQSLESHRVMHVLVKGAAFRTWFTLLNYLYTDKVAFLPLSSAHPGRCHESSTSSLDEPCCSAKSMYRLASKVGLDYLRDEALDHIQSQLTEHNIIKELSGSLVSRHPELLEMELDVLHSYAASPSVVADFPTLVRRIANKELAHGADIILGIHMRFLKQLHPLPKLTPAAPLHTSSGPQEPVENTPGVVENENEGESEPGTTASRGRRGKGKKNAKN